MLELNWASLALPLPFQVIFPILLGFTIIQRLAELIYSRLNQIRMEKWGLSRADSRISYSVMVAVHSTWFVAMMIEYYFLPTTVPDIIRWIALLVFLGAQGLRFWALRSLGTQWNVNVMTQRGEEPSIGFVSSGPYRYVRHPNYLAVIAEFISLPLIGGALFCAVLWSIFNGLVLKNRIKEEEEFLFARPGYREMMGRRPKILPFRLVG